MSSKASTKENCLSNPKPANDSCTTFCKSSKTTSGHSKSILTSMFQSNSNAKPKFHKQNIVSQSSDESLVSDRRSKESSSETLKNKDINNSNKFYNSTQVSDSNKMVVSFQSGNSGVNQSITNNSISCKSTGSALDFVAPSNSTRAANKPAAGKVLKNGSSSQSATKGRFLVCNF